MIYDAISKAPRYIFNAKNSVHCMLFNSSFNILYTASFTNDVVAFSFESPSEISESYILKGHESTITSIALVE